MVEEEIQDVEKNQQVAVVEGGIPVYKGKVNLKRMKGVVPNTDPEDFIIPRLTLAQDKTPQIKKHDAAYIEGLEEGDLFNTVTKQIYGGLVHIIPLYFKKTRTLFNDDFKTECSSPDSKTGGKLNDECVKCEFSKWGTGKNGTGTACTLFYNFAVLVSSTGKLTDDPLDWELVMLSLKSSGVGSAKTLLNFIEKRVLTDEDDEKFVPDMYAGIYRLGTSVATSKNKTSFFTFTMNNPAKEMDRWVHALKTPKGKDGAGRVLEVAEKRSLEFEKINMHVNAETDNDA